MAMATPIQYAPDGNNAVESSEVFAHSALQDWQWAVQGVASIAVSDEDRTALRGLVTWYERICVDDEYDSPAPADGLDALAAHEHDADPPLLWRDLVFHWAVRVAQELAECRRPGLAANGDPAASLLAHTKLDLALRGAFDRLC
jgi:hypothetical protein